MNRADLEEKLADYAFGNISDGEREVIATELANYPDLASEYQTVWQPIIEILPLGAESAALPATLRQRVLGAALREERVPATVAQAVKLDGATNAAVTPAPLMERKIVVLPNSWWRKIVVLFSRPQVAFAGIAVLLVLNLVSIGWGLSLNSQLAQQQAQLTAEQQEVAELLADHNTQMVALQPTQNWKKGYGSAIYDPDKNLIYVTLSGPPPQDALYCQLWALKNEQPVSLGIFKMNGSLVSNMIHSPIDLKGYDELMISWEPLGGSNTPTPRWVMVEGKIQNN